LSYESTFFVLLDTETRNFRCAEALSTIEKINNDIAGTTLAEKVTFFI
jgi:hypothetical protein